MQIYLVGGAIRDRLLGLPAPFEQDWVVVGSSPEEMESKGFIKLANLSLYISTLKLQKNMLWQEQRVNLGMDIMALISMQDQILH